MSKTPDERSFGEKATDAWLKHLPEVPDWVVQLAAWTDRMKLRGVAARLGVSTTMISQVIGKKYNGDMSRIETVVRGSLMGETVACPVLGDMTRDICLGWQAKEPLPSSSMRSQMYDACRAGCPHSRLAGGDDAHS